MRKILNNFLQLIRMFYDLNAYRDYVFRQKGYGIRLLALILMISMIPSYLQLSNKTHHLFQDKVHQEIQTLPTLHLVNQRLQVNDQAPATMHILDQQHIQWFENHQRYNSPKISEDGGYLLSNFGLLYQLPDLHIFGLQLAHNPLYLPLYLWSQSDFEYISGVDIASNLKDQQYHLILLWSWLMSYLIDLLYIVIFVRSFAFIARKMVLWFMREELSYAVACRLLCISGVIPLIVVAMISYFHPVKEESKYIYSAIYMLNFYFSVRVISARSANRWLSELK